MQDFKQLAQFIELLVVFEITCKKVLFLSIFDNSQHF